MRSTPPDELLATPTPLSAEIYADGARPAYIEGAGISVTANARRELCVTATVPGESNQPQRPDPPPSADRQRDR